MTVNYHVEIDGATVWSADTDEPYTPKFFPPEFLSRPTEPPEGAPHPSPHHLFVDGTLVGIQRTHADEADELDNAAVVAETNGDHADAFGMRLDAHEARAASAAARGEIDQATAHRVARVQYMAERITADPTLTAVIQAKGF